MRTDHPQPFTNRVIDTGHQSSTTVLNDAALVAVEALSVEKFATRNMMSVDKAIEKLAEPAFLAEAERLAVDLELSGEATQAIAMKALGGAVKQLGLQIEQGDLGAGTLVRIAELLYRVSGLSERTQQSLAKPETGWSLTINMPTSPMRVEKVVEHED